MFVFVSVFIVGTDLAVSSASNTQTETYIMATKTISERIKTLMVVYSDYTLKVKDCVKLEYGSDEYKEAESSRDFYERWLREELAVVERLGFNIDIL